MKPGVKETEMITANSRKSTKVKPKKGLGPLFGSFSSLVRIGNQRLLDGYPMKVLFFFFLVLELTDQFCLAHRESGVEVFGGHFAVNGVVMLGLRSNADMESVRHFTAANIGSLNGVVGVELGNKSLDGGGYAVGDSEVLAA
jgi:hypothetical protein